MNAKLAFVKLIFIVLLLFSQSILANGIEVLLNPINPYSFGSRDFGGVTLINAGPEKEVFLKCLLKSSSGEVLVEAKSARMPVKTGANTISPINLSYSYIHYSIDNLKVADQRTRSFPAGSYTYCIEVYESVTDVLSGTECANITIELLTPPIALLPENNSEREDIYPYFSWIPPMPTPVRVSYRFTIVKVSEGQSSLDAILRNPPLHQIQIGTNFYQYPVSAVRLEKGGKYAWQVKALINEDPSEKKTGIDYKTESEVFDFTIKSDPKKPATANPYANINFFGNEVYYCNDTLKILYKEEYNPGTISYTIFTSQSEVLIQKKESLAIILGENLLQIPIQSFGIKTGELYIFELQNKSGQKFRLKFIKLK